MSRSLNKNNGSHSIPHIKDISPNGKTESQVSFGESKKWYIFRVKILAKYLKSKHDAPEKLRPSEYRKKLKGRKDIIIFEVPGWGDATGHADLWMVNVAYGKVMVVLQHLYYFGRLIK